MGVQILMESSRNNCSFKWHGKMDHIKENIKESNNGYASSLTEKELELIDKVKDIYISRIKVDCTNCRYCMPCPFGVNIPKNFKYLNMASIYSDVKNKRKST